MLTMVGLSKCRVYLNAGAFSPQNTKVPLSFFVVVAGFESPQPLAPNLLAMK